MNNTFNNIECGICEYIHKHCLSSLTNDDMIHLLMKIILIIGLTLIIIIIFFFFFKIGMKRFKKKLENLKLMKNNIFQSLPIGIEVYDKNGILIEINDATVEILGITDRDKYIDLKINLFSNPFIPSDIRDRIYSGEICKAELEINFDLPEIKNKNITKIKSGIKYLGGIAKPVFDKSNSLLYYILIFEDVSERINIQKELVIAKERAECSEKMKSAFIANMSHEVRTPLNSIIGFSELLIEEPTIDRNIKEEYVSIIKHNNEQLLQLINDVLYLSDIESGKIPFSLAKYKLSELLQQWLVIGQLVLKNSKTHLLIEIGDYPETIVTDNGCINLVITNFIKNANKYTKNGTITIGFHWINEYKSVYFFVRDNGHGISEKHLPYIFDRFYKVDHFVPGMGLGLTICKKIIVSLNGEIGVNSSIDKGSEFWFSLPVN